jgi:hypothetical protein
MKFSRVEIINEMSKALKDRRCMIAVMNGGEHEGGLIGLAVFTVD